MAERQSFEFETKMIRAAHRKKRHAQRPGARRVNLMCAHCGGRLGPIYEFGEEVFTPVAQEISRIDGEIEGPAHMGRFDNLAGKQDFQAHPHFVDALRAADYRWRFWCERRTCPNHTTPIVAVADKVKDAVLQALEAGRNRVRLPL